MQSTLKNELKLLTHRYEQFLADWNDDTVDVDTEIPEKVQARQLYENAYNNWKEQVKPFLEKCIDTLQVGITIHGGVCYVDQVDDRITVVVRDYDVEGIEHANIRTDDEGDRFLYSEFKGA